MEPRITDLEHFEILRLFQVLVYRKTAASGRLSVLILIWLSFLVIYAFVSHFVFTKVVKYNKTIR